MTEAESTRARISKTQHARYERDRNAVTLRIRTWRESLDGKETPHRGEPFGPWPFTLEEARLLVDIVEVVDCLAKGRASYPEEEWKTLDLLLKDLGR